MLGTEPGSSAGAAGALHLQAVSADPAQTWFLIFALTLLEGFKFFTGFYLRIFLSK